MTFTGYYDPQPGPETRDALLALLDSDYGDIRTGAAFALVRCRLEKSRSLDTLHETLKGRTPMWVRLNALNLLDELDAETFETLRPTLRRIAQWSLTFQQRMSPRRYVRELAQDLLEMRGEPDTA